MRIRLAVLALAASLAGPAAWAQSGGAGAAPAAGMKVGVINVQVAITSTSEGKQAAAELQSQFAPRQSELDNLRRQVEDIQTRLRTGASTLSDDEKARLAREGDQFLGIGEKQAAIPPPGTVVYADDRHTICFAWNHRAWRRVVCMAWLTMA